MLENLQKINKVGIMILPFCKSSMKHEIGLSIIKLGFKTKKEANLPFREDDSTRDYKNSSEYSVKYFMGEIIVFTIWIFHKF